MRSNLLSYLAIALKASAKVIEIFIRAKVFNAFLRKKKRSNGCGIDFVRPIVNFNRL